MGFSFVGQYRVQSRLRSSRSIIQGAWISPEGTLNSTTLNAALKSSHLWVSGLDNARAAAVSFASGNFTADDAIYHPQYFRPHQGTAQLPSDLIDVTKLGRHWRSRRAPFETIFTPTSLNIVKTIVGNNVQAVSVNEYMCHEGGHMLGRSISEKRRLNWFRPNHTISWPLVYVEEFRADMQAFAFAIELLAAPDAASVFVYNVMHRFGLAALRRSVPGLSSGLVPYYLFCLLHEIDILQIQRHADGRHMLALNVSAAPRSSRQ